MAKVSIIIDIPNENNLKTFYDIWEKCQKEVEKELDKQIGGIDYNISLGYSGDLTWLK